MQITKDSSKFENIVPIIGSISYLKVVGGNEFGYITHENCVLPYYIKKRFIFYGGNVILL